MNVFCKNSPFFSKRLEKGRLFTRNWKCFEMRGPYFVFRMQVCMRAMRRSWKFSAAVSIDLRGPPTSPCAPGKVIRGM